MFSSTYNSSNPYPCFPSYSYPPPPFLDPENTTIHHLLHDVNPVGVNPFILPTSTAANNNNVANAPSISETVANLAAVPGCAAAAAMPKQDNHHNSHYNLPNFFTIRKAGGGATKKDRHSKIYTSQGLRDRRVRLSIEIARKFFDLQDMLGFDKASNTLEWLFTKSKRAIKELSRTKHSCSAKSFSSSSECEEVVSQMKSSDIFHQLSTDPAYPSNLQAQQGVVVGMVEDSSSSGKEKKLKRAQKEAAVCVAQANYESREKAKQRASARARARERTSHKICYTTSREKKCPATEIPQILHQFKSPIPNESCARSPKMAQLVGSSEAAPRDNNEFNVIEESIVIKRKLKPSLATSHHQNLVIPNKEASFCNVNDYHSFPNLPPNWDTNAGNGRSSFCAIASMNLSTGLQIFGKPWEECTNPRPQ